MSGSGGWKAGQVADMLRDAELDANISAVLADDETVGDVMMRLDDLDRGEGGLSELLRQQSSSDMLRDARKSGDVASMSAATGLSDSSVEATELSDSPVAADILATSPLFRAI